MNEAVKSVQEPFRDIYGDEYFSLTDAISDIVWISDLEFNFKYFNQAVTRLLGYSLEEVLLKKLPEICNSDTGQAVVRRLNEELRKEKQTKVDRARVWTAEIKHVCKNGSTLWTETKMGFLRNREGEAFGFIGVSRDITDRRRQENASQQGKLFSILGEMTSAIASEINNPVGGILLSSEQLMMSNISSQAKKDLSMIHGEAKRVARMMSNLLNSCNLVPQKLERFRLHRLLNKVLEIRKYGHEIHNINVATDYEKRIIYVVCDTDLMQQVFTRLLQDSETALQKSNGGNIVITSRCQGDWVKISIADSRQMNPDNYHDYVFAAFSATATASPEFTRMDMILCHAAIAAHGGQLYLENNRMGGNSFIIELPVYKRSS